MQRDPSAPVLVPGRWRFHAKKLLSGSVAAFLLVVGGLVTLAGPAAALCSSSIDPSCPSVAANIAANPELGDLIGGGALQTGSTATAASGVGAVTVGGGTASTVAPFATAAGVVTTGAGVAAWNYLVPASSAATYPQGPAVDCFGWDAVTCGTVTSRGVGAHMTVGTASHLTFGDLSYAFSWSGSLASDDTHSANFTAVVHMAYDVGGVHDVDCTIGLHRINSDSSLNPTSDCSSAAFATGLEVDYITLTGDSGTATYYAPDDARSPVYTGSDPYHHRILNTLTCEAPDGTTNRGTTSLTPSVTWVPGDVVEVPAITCPNGDRMLDWDPSIITLDPSTGTFGETATQPTVAQAPGVADLPIECFDTGVHCILDLQKLTTPPSTWTDCFAIGSQCAGWYSSPVRESTYRCVFGDGAGISWQSLPISDCYTYQNRFETTPGNLVVPTDPTQAPDAGCDIGWGSLFDGSIFLEAGKCLLVWAFVPDPAVLQASLQTVETAWSSSALNGLLTSLTGPFTAFGSIGNGSGCDGPEIDYPKPSTTSAIGGGTFAMHPWSACAAPMSTVAGVVRNTSTLLIIAVGAIAISSPILRALGAPTIFQTASRYMPSHLGI